MKFNQFSGIKGKAVNDSQTRSLAMSEMLTAAPILTYAEFYPITGNADKSLANPTALGGVQSRAIGSEYSPVAAAPAYVDIELKTIGGIIRTDKAYERQSEDGVASEHLRQVREFARGAGRKFMDLTINGDKTATATDFNGFSKIVKASQTIKFDTDNGGTVPFGTTTANIAQQRKFMEYMDTLIGSISGGPNVLIMDVKVVNRLRSIARDFVQVSTVQDAFGNDQTIAYYLGVPILTAGYKLDGATKVIGHSETCGTSETCTSIYAVKFGEKMDVTFATNVGLQVETTPESNWLQSRLEFDAGLGLFNDKALARLCGVIIE